MCSSLYKPSNNTNSEAYGGLYLKIWKFKYSKLESETVEVEKERECKDIWKVTKFQAKII